MGRSGSEVNVVVAMDSFKGSLRAAEACEAVREGIVRAVPSARVVLRPMADGGEGTAETLMAARGGEWVPTSATGPLPGTRVEAGFAWLPESGPGALVEMATASGLALLAPHQLDPLRTTTYGTGELLSAATGRGARRLWLAIGGSATVDGGVGAAMALGWQFLDRDGRPIGLGGAELERIVSIVRPDPGLHAPLPPVEVLCDVDNPLNGDRGAARVFGPQKGATPEMVKRLEQGLAHLADVVQEYLSLDVGDVPGSGAAGGLGAGALAFLGAELVSGVDAVMHANGMDEAMASAGWVITGEGRFDRQSLHGKVVSGIVRIAGGTGTRVGVIAGSVEVPAEEWRAQGIHATLPCTPPRMSLEDAMALGRELLARAAERFARDHLKAS
jgi:glycerate kinase